MKYRLCSKDEVPDGEMRQFEVEGEVILVANIEGLYYAISDLCSHAEAFLSEGVLEEHRVQCPYHGAEFDVRTGEPLSFPASVAVDSYRVIVEGEDLFIESDLL